MCLHFCSAWGGGKGGGDGGWINEKGREKRKDWFESWMGHMNNELGYNLTQI